MGGGIGNLRSVGIQVMWRSWDVGVWVFWGMEGVGAHVFRSWDAHISDTVLRCYHN